MATSGAYRNQVYTFNFSFTKASDPTAFFTGTLLTSEVQVTTRDGATTNAAASIATAPTHEGNGVYEINLSASEMNHDEIIIVLVPSAADVVPESISIVTEPTPSDVLEVQKTAVSGIADFRATGFSTFDPAVDTVANVTTVGTVSGSVGSVVASVTAGTVTDKSGYFISGTKTTLDVLNDVAATDIVSAGAITTLAGAVVNVDTVDVTTTNSDMRGTDGAYTGTPATAGDVADAVWDEALSGHNIGGSTGKALRQMKEGTITIESAINDTSATALSFVTDLTEATSSYYSNKIMVFISGHLSGQARIITSYNGTTKAITLEEALTSAPADGDEFLILATHENSVGEIQAGLATSAEVAVVDANVDQILLDTGTDGVVISTAQAQTLADEVLKRSVTNTQDSADAHSLAAIVLGILESSRSSTTWTIKKTTGSTFTTKILTLDSEADPVIGVD
jgi:hypothetical protein